MTRRLYTHRTATIAALTLAFVLMFVAVTPASADTTLVDTAHPVLSDGAPEASDMLGDTAHASSTAPVDRSDRLASYSRFVNIWRIIRFVVGAGVLSLLLFTGLSARFRTWASIARHQFAVTWLYAVIFLVAHYLLILPFSIYRRFVVETDYGFLNQTFWQWWGDDLLNLALELLLAVVPIWLLYFTIRKYRRWWLAFTIVMAPVIVLLVAVAPVFVSPMFNKFEPLKDEALETEIRDLAVRAGIGDADIFQVDASRQSNRLNAYVTGVLGSERIVLYDTMIDNFTVDEIKFVMSHEIGHYVKRHIWWGLLVTVLFLGFAAWLTGRTIGSVIRRFRRQFGFDRLSDIASLPLLLLFASVILFLFQPITNAASREMERQADRFSMELSGASAETATSAFEKLSSHNLSDPDPHPVIEFWFYTHPALKKRIAFVQGYRP